MMPSRRDGALAGTSGSEQGPLLDFSPKQPVCTNIGYFSSADGLFINGVFLSIAQADQGIYNASRKIDQTENMRTFFYGRLRMRKRFLIYE